MTGSKVSSGITTTASIAAAANNNNNNKHVVVRHATFIAEGWGGGRNLDQKFTLVTLSGLCLLILVKVGWRQD